MAKRKLRDADLDALSEQMRNLRKKLKKVKKAAIGETEKPVDMILSRKRRGDEPSPEEGQIVRKIRSKEAPHEGESHGQKSRGEEPSLEEGQLARNETTVHATQNLIDSEISEQSEAERDAEEKNRLDSSSSGSDGSDTEDSNSLSDGEVRDVEEKKKDAKTAAASLSNETREKLCLKTEPVKSNDVTLHPVLVEEWTKWLKKGLSEKEEDEEKKREEEENKLREEIMKKFPRKGELYVEAPKLNQEILAYMSVTAKSRDKHFVAAQNALGSAMIGVAKSISLISELEEGDITSMLLEFL